MAPPYLSGLLHFHHPACDQPISYEISVEKVEVIDLFSVVVSSWWKSLSFNIRAAQTPEFYFNLLDIFIIFVVYFIIYFNFFKPVCLVYWGCFKYPEVSFFVVHYFYKQCVNLCAHRYMWFFYLFVCALQSSEVAASCHQHERRRRQWDKSSSFSCSSRTHTVHKGVCLLTCNLKQMCDFRQELDSKWLWRYIRIMWSEIQNN